MTSWRERRSWLGAQDPLALRVIAVAYVLAILYAAALATRGFVDPEGTATLSAGDDDFVVVVTGEASADGPVADALGDAILTVPRDEEVASLLADVRLLAPSRLVILGGSDVVSAEAAARLSAATTASVTRLAGQDRWATAARAALWMSEAPVDEVLVASSEDEADRARETGHGGSTQAACRAPLRPCGAVPSGTPVLLVSREGVPPATTQALQHLRPERLTVVGAVSEAVLQELRRHARGDVRHVPPT